MTAQLINICGLILNIIGVALVFFFGLPQPSHQESVGRALAPGTPMGDGRTAGDYAIAAKRKKRLYYVMSHFALSLMVLGLALQLTSALS